MGDAAFAHDLVIKLTLPARMRGDSKKGQITFAHRELSKVNKKWTWRRVKSFFYDELPDDVVRARELRELKLAVALREARKLHAEFNAETDRLEAAHSRQDADFYSDQIEARRVISRGMGRSRIEGGE